MRTIKASTAACTRGRPGYARRLDPSNFLAISRRYHVRMVSGFATHATSARHLRPSRLPISARVALSGSESRSRAGSCERRMRFSAARYSHCRSRRWLTSPVMYANSRTHLFSCIMNEYHNRSLAWRGSDEYFGRTGTLSVRSNSSSGSPALPPDHRSRRLTRGPSTLFATDPIIATAVHEVRECFDSTRIAVVSEVILLGVFGFHPRTGLVLHLPRWNASKPTGLSPRT